MEEDFVFLENNESFRHKHRLHKLLYKHKLQHRLRHRFYEALTSHNTKSHSLSKKKSGEKNGKPHVGYLINDLDPTFYRQIATLRKSAPYTDVFVSNTPEDNLILLEMGYQAVKLTNGNPENTIWVCRHCVGGMLVTDISVRFQNDTSIIEVEPDKAKIVLKITEQISIMVTKQIGEPGF